MRNSLVLIAFVTTLTIGCIQSQVKKNIEFYRYELECMGTGNEGTYLLKVFSYVKRPRIAINEAKRNAVHGVIFKGFASGYNCQPQKSLASNPGVEEQFKDYFLDFFSDNGKYLKYVSISNDAVPDQITKMKREYKIGITVSVMKDALRAELEQAGVIKGLNSGF